MTFFVPSMMGFATPTQSTLWTPLNLTDLKAWFDASDSETITKDGSNYVSQWNDKSGNNRHASQGTGSAQPLHDSVNNRMSFDGSDVLVMASSADIARNIGEINLFALCQFTSTGSQHLINISTNSINTTRCMIGHSVGGTGLVAGGRRLDANSFAYVASGSNNTDLNILHGKLDYANSNAYTYVNGGSPYTNTSFQTDGLIEDTSSPFAGIGAYNAGGAMTGYVNQVVIAGVMTDTERLKLEGWCAHYTSQTTLLDMLHPYKSSPPTV